MSVRTSPTYSQQCLCTCLYLQDCLASTRIHKTKGCFQCKCSRVFHIRPSSRQVSAHSICLTLNQTIHCLSLLLQMLSIQLLCQYSRYSKTEQSLHPACLCYEDLFSRQIFEKSFFSSSKQMKKQQKCRNILNSYIQCPIICLLTLSYLSSHQVELVTISSHFKVCTL
ncbi:hypothetical protein FGO68_gene3406 [Halteria grandinella]|uniref:Uncharacterized protein n=1 Tax=Halteria grandinella TaxID=5974 RepID=A0A8J8P0D0_HALGN|nr:hypothetical protein FGO68_gene3406 [Halteria grandinella]